MAANNGLSSNKMAARIYNRKENQYKQSMIKEILDMYRKYLRNIPMERVTVRLAKTQL